MASDDTPRAVGRFVTEEQHQIEVLQKEVAHLQEALLVFMTFVEELAARLGQRELEDAIELDYIRKHITQGDDKKLNELLTRAREVV